MLDGMRICEWLMGIIEGVFKHECITVHQCMVKKTFSSLADYSILADQPKNKCFMSRSCWPSHHLVCVLIQIIYSETIPKPTMFELNCLNLFKTMLKLVIYWVRDNSDYLIQTSQVLNFHEVHIAPTIYVI